MSSKKNGSFIKIIFTITAWILVLSAFGVTAKDIIALDWFNDVALLITNFFVF